MIVYLTFFLVLIVYSQKVFDKVCVSEKCDNQCCYYPRVVWAYWGNVLNISEDIQEMIDVTRNSLLNFTYILLCNENLTDFLNVSSFPRLYFSHDDHEKSEYIRWALLEKYGGMWIDASTYVNSGVEMEWFFSEAVKSKREMWGFGFGREGLVHTNFFGGCQYSEPIRLFRNRLEERFASDDFLRICDKKNCSQFRCSLTCCDQVFIKFFRDNPYLNEKILALPKGRNHYKLSRSCGGAKNCIQDKLLNDPNVLRAFPFIKLDRYQRVGRKLRPVTRSSGSNHQKSDDL